MRTNTEKFAYTLVAENESNIHKKVNINEYQRKNIDNLNIAQQFRFKSKRGKELENYLSDMYSSKLKKEKEQLDHQLIIELDIAKKRLTNDGLEELAQIEADLKENINSMLEANVKSTYIALSSLSDLCENLKEEAKKYEEKNPTRYKKFLELLQKKEDEGWELIDQRSEELITKHHIIFQQTTKLLSQVTEKYE
jgi:hypothetical protein